MNPHNPTAAEAVSVVCDLQPLLACDDVRQAYFTHVPLTEEDQVYMDDRARYLRRQDRLLELCQQILRLKKYLWRSGKDDPDNKALRARQHIVWLYKEFEVLNQGFAEAEDWKQNYLQAVATRAVAQSQMN